MKSIFTFVFMFLFLFSSFAENDGNETKSNKEEVKSIYLAGSVKDLKTGEYLVGVKIEIEGTELKTYTDFDGNFVFENISPGTYNILADFISYEKEKLENMEISSRTSMIELQLHSLQ